MVHTYVCVAISASIITHILVSYMVSLSSDAHNDIKKHFTKEDLRTQEKYKFINSELV